MRRSVNCFVFFCTARATFFPCKSLILATDGSGFTIIQEHSDSRIDESFEWLEDWAWE
jgi:hypothetical protein